MKLLWTLAGALAALIAIAATVLFFLRPQKSGGEGNVYAVTRHGEGYILVYRYWKNGASAEPFGTDGRSLGLRCEVGRDVYEAASEDGAPFVKKNGEKLHSLTDGSNDGSLSYICVSGPDVLAGGGEYLEGDHVATIWKNGEVHKRLTSGIHPASVMSLVAPGRDLFAGGYAGDFQDQPEAPGFAAVWKNGAMLRHLTDGTISACANSLFVHGGDVYAGGWAEGEERDWTPTVWKNGDMLYRLGGESGEVALLMVK